MLFLWLWPPLSGVHRNLRRYCGMCDASTDLRILRGKEFSNKNAHLNCGLARRRGDHEIQTVTGWTTSGRLEQVSPITYISCSFIYFLLVHKGSKPQPNQKIGILAVFVQVHGIVDFS